MTIFSCLGVGVAFMLAVSLLVAAGVLIGWVIPVRGPRAPEPPGTTDEREKPASESAFWHGRD